MMNDFGVRDKRPKRYKDMAASVEADLSYVALHRRRSLLTYQWTLRGPSFDRPSRARRLTICTLRLIKIAPGLDSGTATHFTVTMY